MMKINPASKHLLWIVTAVSWSWTSASVAEDRFTGPWNLETLKQVPEAEWGETKELVREVYYTSEPDRNGKPTRVFAYYAKPEGEGPFPGMVLVHGGGGTAFSEWATLWAKRGYAAIAMDLAGCGPGRKRLPNGGPGQGHDEKFAEFTEETATRMWTYHAVAAVIRGHSLLASRQEVDAERIGITGISWGGYLTCIVSGLDDRLKVSVPVYGCGFLHENSTWLGLFTRMKPEQRKRWVDHFDPSKYLPGVGCPILFVNGTNDFAYPLDSYRKSYRAVPGSTDIRIEVRMPHGHPQGWKPKEIGLFVDSVLLDGDPLAKMGPLETSDGRVFATFKTTIPVTKGELHYTTDVGSWPKRRWISIAAEVAKDQVIAKLPDERPLVYYLSVTDARDAMISTEHDELPSTRAVGVRP